MVSEMGKDTAHSQQPSGQVGRAWIVRLCWLVVVRMVREKEARKTRGVQLFEHQLDPKEKEREPCAPWLDGGKAGRRLIGNREVCEEVEEAGCVELLKRCFVEIRY